MTAPNVAEAPEADRTPILLTNSDGTWRYEWPHGRPDSFLMTPELFEEMVAERNRLFQDQRRLDAAQAKRDRRAAARLARRG